MVLLGMHQVIYYNVPFLFPKDRQMCNTGRIGYNEGNVSLFFNEYALDYTSEYRGILYNNKENNSAHTYLKWTMPCYYF